MEFVLYTIAGLLLYGISDYILNAIEIRLGKRLPNRSLVFFVIIAVLAVTSFSVIRSFYQGQEPDQTSGKDQVEQATVAKAPTSQNTSSQDRLAQTQPAGSQQDPAQPRTASTPQQTATKEAKE